MADETRREATGAESRTDATRADRPDAADATGVRVVITGGGTGGHLTPALALASELDARGATVTLVGGTRGLDPRLLPASGFDHRLIDAPSLDRRRWWRNVTLPWRLARAVREARGVVAETRPDVVVGTGGYASAPVGLVAAWRKIPLVLQEQNRAPGIATRVLARWADRVCVQFPEAEDALGERVDVDTTGSPIPAQEPRDADFGGRLDPERPTVGVFGGSQGARAINDAVLGLHSEAPGSRAWNLVWQTGEADHARIVAAAQWPDRYVIRPFFDPMAAVYPRLDVIVCRAGAMTLAEITAWGIPSILIPYPYATADHQDANARSMERAGAALRLTEEELSPRRLGNLVAGLLKDPERRRTMAGAARDLGRPEAAAVVADRVLEAARPGREAA